MSADPRRFAKLASQLCIWITINFQIILDDLPVVTILETSKFPIGTNGVAHGTI